ncbi:unnamed protein product, partial [Linum tenue]
GNRRRSFLNLLFQILGKLYNRPLLLLDFYSGEEHMELICRRRRVLCRYVSVTQ